MNWSYDGPDPAMRLWTAAVKAWGLTLPASANVVELGCAETDWIEVLRAQNHGLSVLGVDARTEGVTHRPGCVQGNAMDADLFRPESLDAVVLLGALEHFGLGFYGDPVQDDGDVVTMRNIARWLKPGGWVYFDVPCNPESYIVENRHYRVYSPEDAGRLVVEGLTERVRGYSFPEPNAGVWHEVPTIRREPYHYVAIVADKGTHGAAS